MGGKLAEMGNTGRSSSRGDRWGAAQAGFSTPTLLGTNSRPELDCARSTVGALRPIQGDAPAHAHSVAGVLVTRVPRPGDRRRRPGVVDHHHDLDDRRPPPLPARQPTAAPTRPTTPKPDPDAFAALANQVSQNQAMLAQMNAQVDAGRRTDHRARRPDRRDAAAARRHPRRGRRGSRQIVRDRAAFIYRHADAPQTAVVDIDHIEDISVGKEVRASRRRITDGTQDRRALRSVSAQLDVAARAARSRRVPSSRPAEGPARATRRPRSRR